MVKIFVYYFGRKFIGLLNIFTFIICFVLILFLSICHNQIAKLDIFDTARKEKVTQNKYFRKFLYLCITKNFNSK